MSKRPLRAVSPSVSKYLRQTFSGSLRAPDVPRLPVRVGVQVHRLVAEEVQGADHVVPWPAVQHVREPVLAAGQEVRLDPQPQIRLLAHELAVGVEVVAGPVPVPGVAPHVERLREAVDVLGHPELLDSALGGGLPVTLRVRGREVRVGRRVVLVGTEVHVVVGQHRERRIASATRRSSAVVTLMFSGGASTSRTLPPPASTSEASSVAAASRSSLTSRALRSTSARNT